LHRDWGVEEKEFGFIEVKGHARSFGEVRENGA